MGSDAAMIASHGSPLFGRITSDQFALCVSLRCSLIAIGGIPQMQRLHVLNGGFEGCGLLGYGKLFHFTLLRFVGMAQL
jgi:hypothetical protein